MGFRLRISDVTYLPASRAWALDGVLESGEVAAGSSGIAELRDSRPVRIEIRSVALVNGPPLGIKALTLEIEEPPVPTQSLRGALLVGE